jgi:hypothetical protein
MACTDSGVERSRSVSSKDEIALRVSRLQITEQCRARAADVQEAGGAGCKTGSHHAVSLELPFMGAKKAASVLLGVSRE